MKFRLAASQPRRNLTVKGISVSEPMARRMSRIRPGERIRAEPAPARVTLGTGQPAFTSIRAGRRAAAMAAALAMRAGSEPKSWMA